GIHKIAGIKTSASLIATARENGTPALVCWQRGKGRVAAMPLFSTWQWALKLAHTQGFQSHYIQFWRGTIRWLTTSEITKKIRIVLGKQEFFVGEKAPIKILLAQEKMKSLKQFDLELKIFQNGQLVQPIPLTALSKTEQRGEWVPSKEGEYQISALLKHGLLNDQETQTVRVKRLDWETENPYPDHAFLQKLSQESGGKYSEAGEFSPELIRQSAQKIQASSSEPVQKNLWTNPWTFSLLLILLILDWALRRWKGDL
ncbi:MAG: hypothetical protein HYS58_00985, partial [Elusimicrobia bacterium]|nr:hypothetical protein [Elusimicrobiota bacterium]